MMPVKLDTKVQEYTPCPKELNPNNLHWKQFLHYWRSTNSKSKEGNDEWFDIKAYRSDHKIFSMWSLGKDKVISMSKVLNMKIHDRCQGLPSSKKCNLLWSRTWNVSLLTFNILRRLLFEMRVFLFDFF
jgi:hypothetical protein